MFSSWFATVLADDILNRIYSPHQSQWRFTLQRRTVQNCKWQGKTLTRLVFNTLCICQKQTRGKSARETKWTINTFNTTTAIFLWSTVVGSTRLWLNLSLDLKQFTIMRSVENEIWFNLSQPRTGQICYLQTIWNRLLSSSVWLWRTRIMPALLYGLLHPWREWSKQWAKIIISLPTMCYFDCYEFALSQTSAGQEL